MLSRKKIAKYIDRRWQRIILISKELSRKPDSEKIHDLRLHGKKLKSITELLKSTSKKPKAFSLSAVKPLFRDAGEVRTAEMHLKLFAEAGVNDAGLENEQRAHITWAYVVLAMKRKEYQDQIRTTRKHVKKNITGLSTREVKKYFSDVIDKLSLAFLWPIDADQLHENRKLIKNLIYVYNMLPGPIQRKIGLDKEYLDDLQDLIGQWHDLALTTALLTEKGSTEREKLALIKQRERDKLAEVKKAAAFLERRVYGYSIASPSF